MALRRGYTFGVALFMWFLAGSMTASAITRATKRIEQIEERAIARASCSAMGGVFAADSERSALCLVCPP